MAETIRELVRASVLREVASILHLARPAIQPGEPVPAPVTVPLALPWLEAPQAPISAPPAWPDARASRTAQPRTVAPASRLALPDRQRGGDATPAAPAPPAFPERSSRTPTDAAWDAPTWPRPGDLVAERPLDDPAPPLRDAWPPPRLEPLRAERAADVVSVTHASEPLVALAERVERLEARLERAALFAAD